jgi:hypothetical protein
MASPDCLASVDICMLRVAQLTATGAPRTGAFGVVTDAIDNVKIGTTNDTVNEFIRKNGCGSIVTRIPDQTVVKGSSFSVDLTRWDRDLIRLLCGGVTLTNSGHSAGYKSPKFADGVPNPCCIEVWAKAWDGSVQAVTTTSTPNASYHCYVLPYVQCSLSSAFTLAGGTDAIFTITGTGSENPNATVNGPWNDWPAFAVAQNGFDSAFGEFDDSTLPTAVCGITTVPSGS